MNIIPNKVPGISKAKGGIIFIFTFVRTYFFTVALNSLEMSG